MKLLPLSAVAVGVTALLACGGGSSSGSGKNSGLANAVPGAATPSCEQAVARYAAFHELTFPAPLLERALRICRSDWSEKTLRCVADSATPGELLECRTGTGEVLFLPAHDYSLQLVAFVEEVCACKDRACVESRFERWNANARALKAQMKPDVYERLIDTAWHLERRATACSMEIAFGQPAPAPPLRAATMDDDDGSPVPTCAKAIEQYASVYQVELTDHYRKLGLERCHRYWGKSTKRCIARASRTAELHSCATGRGKHATIALGGPAEMFGRFVDQVCACPDIACVRTIQEEWGEYGSQIASDVEQDESGEVIQQIMRDEKRMGDCVTRIEQGKAP